MKTDMHMFNPKVISKAVLNVLSKEFEGAQLSLAYEVMAASHGFPSWNHMAAFLKANQPATQAKLEEVPLITKPVAPADWPLRFKSGMHIIACRAGVPTQTVTDIAIAALVSCPSAMQLIEQGFTWKMNLFMPDHLLVADIFPNLKDSGPGYFGDEIRTLPSHSKCHDQQMPLSILEESKNLFLTRVFQDVDRPSTMRRCIEEASINPVIVVMSSDDAAGALQRLAELHCPRQVLLNQTMIRRIDVITALDRDSLSVDSIDCKYANLLDLISGREVTLVKDDEEITI